jgi:outer membrane protein TolC
MFFHFLLSLALAGDAPTDTITLKQAVEMALAASPEIHIVQAQQDAAQQAINEARSAFIPAFFLGSGAAYTRGTSQLIEGQPPSLGNAILIGQLVNKPLRYAVEETRANARAVTAGSATRRDDLIWRVATTYLDLEHTTGELEVASKETDSLTKIQALMLERVKEGQELPSEGTRARLNVARHRQHLLELEGRSTLLEATLKSMLSLPEDRHIRTVSEPLASIQQGDVPYDSAAEENRAVTRAWENSPELKKLAFEVQAKQARLRAEDSQKYPQMELLVNYAYLSRATRFVTGTLNTLTPNNIQLGTSIKIPLFGNARISARMGEATAELTQAKNTLEAAKRRIALEVRQAFQQSREAGAAREVARLELELARENTTATLSRFEEGRAGSKDLEQSRLEESAKWNTLLDTGFLMDRVRLQLLKATGEISKVLQ